MCRFLAYLGKDPIYLNDLLAAPENSLIRQSREAQDITYKVNADGFGIGWYNLPDDPIPGLFKSIQPAWNNENLLHLVRVISSTCFMGHVRASTVGNVSQLNCHPFTSDKYLFVHNGTVGCFESFRQALVQGLSPEGFDMIKGQTDSEHIFASIMDSLDKKKPFLPQYPSIFSKVLRTLHELQPKDCDQLSELNTVFSDGQQMAITRYTSGSEDTALTLYYTTRQDKKNGQLEGLFSKRPPSDYIIVASEPLTEDLERWKEVPINHMLLVDNRFQIKLYPIE